MPLTAATTGLADCFDLVDQLRQERLLHLAPEFRDVGAGGEEPARAGQHDGLDAGVGIGLGEGLLQPDAQRMAQRIDRRIVHADDGDVALLVRFHDCHGCAPSFTQYVGSVSPGLAGALPKGYSAGTKHSREDKAMLRGMMMDRPLLVSSVIDYAADVYPDVEIVSQHGRRRHAPLRLCRRRASASASSPTP